MPGQAGESAYWARFEEAGAVVWRFDTRIYGRPRTEVHRDDRPIGCIIGKNPGSALPDPVTGALQPLLLRGDRFLPTVRAIVRKSFTASASTWPEGAYVQVLNLFYLCNRDLTGAIGSLRRHPGAPRCATERRRFPWCWYAWGGPDRRLDGLKDRFLRRAQREAFFFCGETTRVLNRAPLLAERARHTQGMPHEHVVASLAEILRASSAAVPPASVRG